MRSVEDEDPVLSVKAAVEVSSFAWSEAALFLAVCGKGAEEAEVQLWSPLGGQAPLCRLKLSGVTVAPSALAWATGSTQLALATETHVLIVRLRPDFTAVYFNGIAESHAPSVGTANAIDTTTATAVSAADGYSRSQPRGGTLAVAYQNTSEAQPTLHLLDTATGATHQQQVPRVSLLAGCPQRGLCATVHPIEPEEDAEWRATPARGHEAMGAAELEKEVERRKRYPRLARLVLRDGNGEELRSLDLHFAPRMLVMNDTHVFAASYGLVVAWQFAQRPFGPTPWRMTNDEGLQTAILPTDAAWPNPSATFRFDVLDESRPAYGINCMVACDDKLIFCDSDGYVARFALLATGSLGSKREEPMHHASAPQQCFINSDGKMMASIDRSGTLTLTDVSEDKFGANVQSETIGQARGRLKATRPKRDDEQRARGADAADADGRSAGDGSSDRATSSRSSQSHFAIKDVLQMMWSSDDPETFVVMRRAEFVVYVGRGVDCTGGEPVPLPTPQYLCSFHSHRGVCCVSLEQLLLNQTPSAAWLVYHDERSQQEARAEAEREVDWDEAPRVARMAHIDLKGARIEEVAGKGGGRFRILQEDRVHLLTCGRQWPKDVPAETRKRETVALGRAWCAALREVVSLPLSDLEHGKLSADTVEASNGGFYRVALCNPGIEGSDHHGGLSASAPPKLKHRATLALPAVRSVRIKDEGLWAAAYCINDADFVYGALLPWMVETPLAAAAEATLADASSGLRSPMHSQASVYRSLLEALRYMLLRGSAVGQALSARQVKLLFTFLRFTMVKLAKDDVEIAWALSAHDRTVIDLATRQLALATVKAFDSHGLPGAMLEAVQAEIDDLMGLVAKKPLDLAEQRPAQLVRGRSQLECAKG